jgi:non-ribosomal peptide synthetase component F
VEQGAEWFEYFEAPAGGVPTAGFEASRWPEAYRTGDLALRLESWRAPCAPFRLKLLALFRGSELVLELQHDGAVLSPEDADGLLAGFETLLRDGLAHEGRVVSELTMAAAPDPAAAGEIGGESAEARSEPASDAGQGVHELFFEQARLHPDRVATVCGAEVLSFGALARRASLLAAWLRVHGVGPEAPVALMLDKGQPMAAAVLGALAAGGYYVPVDPGLPEEYRRQMLDAVDPPVVLTAGAVGAGFEAPGRTVLRLERGWNEGWDEIASAAAAAPSAPTPPIPPVSGDQLAYVLFTSGSSGEPKGVAVAHRQIARYAQAIRSRLELGPGTRFALLSSFAADLGNTMLYAALCGGGRLLLVPDERAIDPELAVADLAREPVDCLKLAPSHLEALLTASDPGSALPAGPGGLLVLGGEALRWDLVDRVAALAPECAVVNHYGPTETTVGVLTRSAAPCATFGHTSPIPAWRRYPAGYRASW